jgi:hypothetical protein
MSITLKIKHIDGLRLRQQAAHKVERSADGSVVGGTKWSFEREEPLQDTDARKVDSDGKPMKLGTYTIYITAGLKNLVIEYPDQVKATHVEFRNSAIRNQIRVRYQTRSEVKKGEKVHYEWKDSGSAQYVPANTFSGVHVDQNQRAILDECPT